MSRAHRRGSAGVMLGVLVLACGGNEPRPQPQEFATDSVTASSTAPPAPTVLLFGKSGPADQGGYHPDFLAFRTELMRVAEARDSTALFRMLSPDFKASFGGDEGPQGLRLVYRIGAADTEFWGQLVDVLVHGGRFVGDEQFVAPWTFGGLPDSLDAFTHLIVREEGVAVRAAPDVESREVATLSYDIVRAASSDADGWRAIALVDGGVGYVEAARIRSPIDHRAIFERRGGRWWFVAFVAGD